MAQKRNVMILFGGRSNEHDVSLMSVSSIIKNIDTAKYNLHLIGITREGIWKHYQGDAADLTHWQNSSEPIVFPADPSYGGYFPYSCPQEIHKIDVAFPVMHGTYAEDGTIQSVLELAGIPYVGSGVLASALAMDKVAAKQICAQNHIPQCDFDSIEKYQWLEDKEAVLQKLENRFSYPVFVKPANMGSSVGINKAVSRESLMKAIEEALRYDRKVIVEEFIRGREIECAVLGNAHPKAAIPGEVFSAKEFYDYAAKYDNSLGSTTRIPADIPQPKIEEIRRIAIQAYQALGCKGLSRVDFFLTDADQRVLLNEVNTLPGFTSISMYPKMWIAMGMSYSELIDTLLELAIEEANDKNQLQY